MTVTNRQVGSCFAVEVSRVDMGKPLRRDALAAVHAGMDKYAVRMFHDQKSRLANSRGARLSARPSEQATQREFVYTHKWRVDNLMM